MTKANPTSRFLAPYLDNFNTLREAFQNNDACMLEYRDRKTGAPCAVICVVNDLGGGEFEYLPFVRMFDGDPAEDVLAPAPDGGFVDVLPAPEARA